MKNKPMRWDLRGRNYEKRIFHVRMLPGFWYTPPSLGLDNG